MHFHFISLLMVVQSFFSCVSTPQESKPTTSDIIFKSVDGGKSWTDISGDLPSDVSANTIYYQDNKIYIGAEKGLFVKDENKKNSKWEKDLFTDKRIMRIIPTKSGLVLQDYETGISQKMDQVGMWQSKYPDQVSNGIFNYLETTDGILIMGSEKGMFRSDDNGKTWVRVYKDDNVLELLEYEGVLLAGCFRGMIRSEDKGLTWTKVLSDDGMIKKISKVDNKLIAITFGPEPLEDNSFGPKQLYKKQNHLLASTDAGKTWHKMYETLDQAFQISDYKQFGDVVFCAHDNHVYRSTDHGKTWESVLSLSVKNNSFILTGSDKAIYAIKVFDGC